MQVSREQFLNQFGSTILVRAKWQLHRIAPPDYMPGMLFDAMTVCKAAFNVSRQEFHSIVFPMIAATHERHRVAKSRRVDDRAFSNALYDVLSEAGVEVMIGPPTEAHGHKKSLAL